MLDVRNLSVSYGPVQALAGISLEVREGEIVALIGANGAGKSSLIHAVAGLAAAAGKVAFRGEEVLGLPSHRIFRRGIALCPEGRMVLGGLTVEENLKLAAPRRRSFADLYELFPRLGERASSRGASLSGGEAQMLAIARALAQEPELLLLDEPSLGLAPNAVQAIFALLPQLRTGIDDPPGRAKPRAGAKSRRPRLSPGERAHRAAGPGGGAAGRRTHRRTLSRTGRGGLT